MRPDDNSLHECPSCGTKLRPDETSCPQCRLDTREFARREKERQLKRGEMIDKSNLSFFIALIFLLLAGAHVFLVISGRWEADFLWNALVFFLVAAALAYIGYRARKEA